VPVVEEAAMAELPRPRFRVGDRVRYTGLSGPEGDPPVLLARGLVGLIIEAPEGRPSSYRVMFGGRPVWLGADRLDWE
jgi:hypothetical protein